MMPELIWGIFPRALAIIYCIALGSLYGQVLPYAGRAGLRPVSAHLAKIAEDYPSWRRFFYFPTLLWLNQSDRFLRIVILAGIVCALLVIIGGPLTPIYLFFCWSIYLSLHMAFGLVYPWDTLLMEAGFLAIFLPPLLFLPQLTAQQVPLPILVFAYQFLIFRVIFGFGKFKFSGTNLKERLYLKSFAINQPIPSPFGWLASHWPGWLWIVGLGYLFLVEVILPFFIFFGDIPRLIAAFGIIILMVGIQLTGNFGFFNLLVIGLCLVLFDTQLSLPEQVVAILQTAFTSWHALLVNFLLSVWALGALIYLFLNSWCSLSIVYWPSLVFAKPLWLRRLIGVFRGFGPFRFFNAYGVFPPMSAPPVKWIPILEGSNDGKHWQSYHFRYMPTEPNSPPRFVAPHHPRLDHFLIYEAFGGTLDDFFESFLSSGDPYAFTHVSLLDSIVHAVLEGNTSIIRLFGKNPFPTTPPKWVRVNCYLFAPTTISEWRETGHWWRKQWVGTHIPARTLTQSMPHCYIDPELFHWDEIVWKRRSPRLRALMTGNLATLEERYERSDLELFWHGFIVEVNAAPVEWDSLPFLIATLRSRYPMLQLRLFENLFAQLSLLLYAQLEPHTLGEAEPPLEFESFFHIGLLTYCVIVQGRTTYVDMLQDPSRALPLLQAFSKTTDSTQNRLTQTGLFYFALFWYDRLVFHARKGRLLAIVSPVNYQQGLPGFLEAVPFLTKQFYSDEEESIPILSRKINDGDWILGEETWKAAPNAHDIA